MAHATGTLTNHLQQALRAQFLFRRDVDYVVAGDEVLIVDEFTGLRTIEMARADVGDIRAKGGRTVLYVHGLERVSHAAELAIDDLLGEI